MFKQVYRKIKKLITPPTIHELRVREWKKNGNEKLRYLYDLDENSTVFDLGGYRGEWSSDIFSMYVCNIYVFEPVKKYYEDIRNRFSKNQYIKILQFGLSNKDTEVYIGMDEDESSIFNQNSNKKELIQLKNVSDFLTIHKIERIDLMKINIEGGEYDLLEELIITKLIQKIRNIQVQFHDFVPDAATRMGTLQAQLKKTHHVTYQHPFVWENWEIN